MPELVLVERDGAVATVTINRPEALNAMNPALVVALTETFHNLARDAAIRVVILTGAGDRAFVAGADIVAMSDMSSDAARDYFIAGQKMCDTIESVPQFVIGVINGYALGGGCEIALACDMRIAGEKARLGLPEVTLGLIPGWGGSQRLPRLVGKGMAKQLIATGEHIDAQEALRIGLVNRVVSPEDLMTAARKIADKVAKNGPYAVRQAMRAIDTGLERTLDEGLLVELEAEVLCFETTDRQEGIRAFVERRPASFTGR